MAEPNNPWGSKNKKKSDFDELMKGLKSFFGGSPKKSDPFQKEPSQTSGLVTIILVLVGGFLLFKSVYQIQPGEQGVVLRFGQFAHTTQPGLHFLIPFVDEVKKVDVESIRKEEFGAGSSMAGDRDGGIFSNRSNMQGEGDLESTMLTADLNVIKLNWVVQYKVRDPEDYLFNIEEPEAAIRDASESVLRRIIGNRGFDFILDNRDESSELAKQEMQALLDKYNSGMQVILVQLQDVNPPDAVRDSFNEVNQAEQDRIRYQNEAQKLFNEKVPKAEGQAKQVVAEAEGYAIERVNRAEGDVIRFNAILKEYRKARDVTRTRLYVEVLREALPQVEEIIIVDQSKKGMMPLINIGAAATTLKPQVQAAPAEPAAASTAPAAQPATPAPFNPRRN